MAYHHRISEHCPIIIVLKQCEDKRDDRRTQEYEDEPIFELFQHEFP
jgi:hypothetical protein